MDKVDFEFVSLHVWMLMAQTTEHTVRIFLPVMIGRSASEWK